MRKFALICLVLAGCTEPTTGTDRQNSCPQTPLSGESDVLGCNQKPPPPPDQRARTEGLNEAGWLGIVAQGSDASCNTAGTHCHVDVFADNGLTSVVTDCDFDSAGNMCCSHQVCNCEPGPNPEMGLPFCSCHDVPPLHMCGSGS